MFRFVAGVIIYTLISMLCFSVFGQGWQDEDMVWNEEKQEWDFPIKKKDEVSGQDKKKSEPQFIIGSMRKKDGRSKKTKTVAELQAEKYKRDQRTLRAIKSKMKRAKKRGLWGQYEYWYGTYNLVQSCMGHPVYNPNLKPTVYKGGYQGEGSISGEKVESKKFEFPHPVF